MKLKHNIVKKNWGGWECGVSWLEVAGVKPNTVLKRIVPPLAVRRTSEGTSFRFRFVADPVW